MSKITKVIARQVYDSRGNPTIEAEVFANNMKARAICPSGASTGSHEAYEKRDLSNKRYLGRSVLEPVKLINKIISKKLKNQSIHNQEKIDYILIKLDGTKQKKKIWCKFIISCFHGG
jgi:enolase